jgi:hypothetical protein
MHVTVYGPFFFMETAITGIVYLDMLQQFLIPQLDEDGLEGRIRLEEMREYLNTRFPGWRIGRAGPIAWPPRSPDLTPLDFSYGDSLKIECSYQLYLRMSLNYCRPQLQK